MKYLKEFNLSDSDLQEIYDKLSDEEWQYVTTTKVQIKELLRYFTSIGITNIKDIFLHRPDILYQYADDMKSYIENCNIPDIIEKIKNDVSNFDLLNL